MTAKHHHYLSQCYLKGFTNGRSKKSKLHVIDLILQKTFDTVPRNVGGIRNFNRIEVKGVDPNKLESDLSIFEGLAATALKRIDKSRVFTGNTKELILQLIAMIAARSPQQRERIAQFLKQSSDRMMSATLETKSRWESQVAKLKIDDPDYENSTSYNEAKAFFLDKKYTVQVAQERLISMEMTAIEAILPCLYDRNWVLIESSESTGPFVTTDKPVDLSWIEPDAVPLLHRRSPGFGLDGTTVYFPVSQDLALLGEFNGREGTIRATEELVASFNSRILANLHQQIYAPKPSFRFYGKDGRIRVGSTIPRQFKT